MRRFGIQKPFVDIATAGRHRGLSTIYIKHNLFHQSKLARDVELQNTHIVLFKSLRDVMQITTLRTLLGLGAELVDWYTGTEMQPLFPLVICWLICCRKQTIDYVIAQTVVLFRQIFFPERLIHLRTLDDEDTKSVYSQVVQSLSRKCKSHFLKSCPKELNRFQFECIVNLL